MEKGGERGNGGMKEGRKVGIPGPGLLSAFAVLPDAVLTHPKDPFYLHGIPEELEPSEPGGFHRPAGRPDVHSHRHPESGVSSSLCCCLSPHRFSMLSQHRSSFLPGGHGRLWRTTGQRRDGRQNPLQRPVCRCEARLRSYSPVACFYRLQHTLSSRCLVSTGARWSLQSSVKVVGLAERVWFSCEGVS